MSDLYDAMSKKVKGAWVVHHAQKTSSTQRGSAEFPAIDAAGKASSLLSQLAASDQATVNKDTLDAFARAAGLNPKTELTSLIEMLRRQRVIDTSQSGDISVLGLTTHATVQHASDIFEDQDPSQEERAAIVLADLTSDAPATHTNAAERLSDEFGLSASRVGDLLGRSEAVGFVDAEGAATDKLYFNGNLFRRDNLAKVTKVLGSLSTADSAKAAELDATLSVRGCVSFSEAERVLGAGLFEKLRAAGMYDVNHVMNSSGEHGFVTRPSAFHKFNDPLGDDAFDLAKALVAALTYGMTVSSSSRGRIGSIRVLLQKLISGNAIGPATAIGEDYRVLEMKGVIQVKPGPQYGYLMRLKKIDIGQMALAVLTTGEAASQNAMERPFSGQMTGYAGPEQTRSDFRRKKQTQESKRLTQDVLSSLRTGGGF